MVAPGSSISTQQSTGASAQQAANQQTSESTQQATSTSFIPGYSQTPILEGIAQQAQQWAPALWQRGYDAYAANQGNINALMQQAQQYASPAQIQSQMGMAEAGAAQAGEQARQQGIQDLQSYGIDPSSGRYAALDQANRVQTAASVAGAGNQQRLAVQQAGFGMENQAIAASMGNQQALNAAGQTFNQALGVGMQLPYSPLGTASQSSQQSYGQGTGESSGSSTQQSSGSSASQQYSPMQQAMGQIAAETGNTGGVGGSVQHFTGVQVARGGYISPALSNSHGAEVDDVPARLNAGEYVIPKDVVDWMGKAHFAKLIQQARKARGDHATAGQQQSTGYQAGGAVAQAPPAAAAPTGTGAAALGGGSTWVPNSQAEGGGYYMPVAQAPPTPLGGAPGQGGATVPSGGGGGDGSGSVGTSGARYSPQITSLLQNWPTDPTSANQRLQQLYFAGYNFPPGATGYVRGGPVTGYQGGGEVSAGGSIQKALKTGRAPSLQHISSGTGPHAPMVPAANIGRPRGGGGRGGGITQANPSSPFGNQDIGQAFAADRQAFGNQDLGAAIRGTTPPVSAADIAGANQPGGVEADMQSPVQGNQYQGGGEVGDGSSDYGDQALTNAAAASRDPTQYAIGETDPGYASGFARGGFVGARKWQ